MEPDTLKLTEFQTRKRKRDEQIVAMFNSLEGMVTAKYDHIAKVIGVSRGTVQKTVERSRRGR